ncbi:MAG TPA: RNA polymerase sigma factor RpoD/SigA [Chthoniobacterales bacterium]|nr:RNA polymerase sigma factor RpoD/SigA [Chthoniobacterales bacterium]
MTLHNNREAIDKYLREIGHLPLLTPKQEIELAGKIKAGNHGARDRMITSNLRLVVTIARSYTNFGLPLADLISEGNIGLVKAVERFDPSKGAKLSSYAVWWIRQAIKRALDDQSRLIRLPVHHRDKLTKMHQITLQMTQVLGREPTDEELSEEIGIDPDKVAKLNTVSVPPASLDARISDDDVTEFGESIADETARTPFETLRDQDLQGKLGGLLKVLNERERKIVRQRFGLGGEKRQTLEDVGVTLGVTRERVRQLEKAALLKMRSALEKSEAPADFPLPMAA